MRKRNSPLEGRSANPHLLADTAPLRLRGIPLPLACILLGIAVLYFGDRSIAGLFPSSSDISGFGEIAAAAEMVQNWWSGTAAVSGSVSTRNATGSSSIHSNQPTRTDAAASTSTTSTGARKDTATSASLAPLPSESFTRTASAIPSAGGVNVSSRPSPNAPVGTGWKGTGGNSLWSNPSNWDNTGPAAGANDLFFGIAYNSAGGAGSTTAQNDIASWSGHKIVFESTASDHSFTITGNGFTLFDFGGATPVFPQIDNESSVLQSFNLTSGQKITFNDTSGSNKGEILANGGDLSFSATTGIDLAGSTQLQINSIAGKTITFNGVISSSGNSNLNSVAINGPNFVVYGAANTYAGETFVNAGNLQFAAGGSANNSIIRLGNTSGTAAAEVDLLPLTGGLSLSSVINARAGSSGSALIDSRNTSGTNTLSGHIALDKSMSINQATAGTLNLTQLRATSSDTTTGIDIKGNTLTFGGGGDFGVTGTIYNSTGTGTVTMSGAGVLTLASGNSYTGGNNLNSGVISVATQTALGSSTTNYVNFNGGTLRITGNSSFNSGLTRPFSETTSGGTIETTATTQSIIQGSFTAATNAPAMNKTGNGLLVLSGSADNVNLGFNVNAGTLKLDKTSSGTVHALGTTTTIGNGGTLLLGNATGDQIFNTAGITMNGGGTFSTGGFSEGTRPTGPSGSGGSAGMGALTLQSTTSVLHAVIDFGSGANGSSLVFNSFVDSGNQFLDLKNWTGLTNGTDNGDTTFDRLLFANNPNLTNANLSNIAFYNDAGTLFATGGMIINYGGMFELVPVPEPGTWFAAFLTVTALGWTQRKRVHRLISR